MRYKYNNKINYFNLFFEHSFDSTLVNLDMNLILYKKRLLDTRLLFLEIKNKSLYTSINLNNFFRYDLYLIKMHDMKQIINNCKFLIYIYDGVNEYNNIYLDVINYFHQTGIKIPIWVFSRNMKMKYKKFFPVVPDDTTFGNIRYEYDYKNNLKHYGISIHGLSKIMYFDTDNREEKVYNYKVCSKFGHLNHFHSELNDENVEFSSRYMLYSNYIENTNLYITNLNLFATNNSKKYCKYEIVLDGVGSTYPSYIYKLISNAIVTKITDNDLRFENNIVWQQWFYPNFNKNIDFFPIYAKTLLSNSNFLNNIIINYEELKLSKKIVLNQPIIDQYFVFMMSKWSKNLIQNDYKYIEERIIHKEYLDLIPFKKYNSMNIDEDFSLHVTDKVKFDYNNNEMYEYFVL